MSGHHLLLTLLSGMALAWGLATAAEPPRDPPFLWSGVVLASEQFWSDERITDGWRLQRCAPTGQYRLLDPRNVRQALGSREECLRVLAVHRPQDESAPRRDVVIALHGLLRTREQMQGLCDYLERRGGFQAVNVNYASTRHTLDEHAANLAQVVSHVGGESDLHFVGHSLGNIVVRRYLAEADATEPKWSVDPRIRRMVMLGPPNNGSQLAVSLGGNKFAWLVAGPCCKALGKEWPTLKERLAQPEFEFGIIAGRGGGNPLLPGEDDLVVSLTECRLPGAKEFQVTPLNHGQLMHHAESQEMVLRFLKEGTFQPRASSDRP